MNNGLLYLGGLLTVILAALFGVPYFVDWNGYRGVFEEEASKVLGRDVRVGGAVNVRFLPTPYVRFEKVRIADPTGQTGEAFMRADSFTMRLAVAPLLRGSLEANEIELSRPVLSFALDSDGSGNWASLQLKPAELPFIPRNVALHSVRFLDGAVSLYGSDGQAIARIEKVNGELAAETLKGPFKFAGRATWSGEERDIKFVTSSPDAEGNIKLKSNLRGALTANSYAFDGALADLSGKPRFTGEVTAKLGLPKLDRAVGDTAGTVMPGFDLKARVDADTSGATFDELTLDVVNAAEPQLISGKASAAWAKEPRFDAALNAKWLDLDFLAGSGGQSATFVKVRQLGLAMLQSLAGDGAASAKIDLEQVKLGGEVAGGLKIDAERVGGVMKIKDMKGGLPGGVRYELSGEIKGETGARTFNGEGLVRGSNLARLQAWMQKSGATIDLKAEGPFWVAGRLVAGENQVELTDAKAEIAGHSLSGELKINDKDTNDKDRRRIAVRLESSKLDTVSLFPKEALKVEGELLKAFGLEGEAGGAPAAAASTGDARQSDLSIRITAGELKHAGKVYRNVDVSVVQEDNVLHIPAAKFQTTGGMTVAASGRVKTETGQPAGTIGYEIEAPTRDAVKDAAEFFALTKLVPDERIAAVNVAKIAGLVKLGVRSKSAADVTFDGTVNGAHIAGRAEFDTGFRTWRTAPSQISAVLKSPDIGTALGLLHASRAKLDGAEARTIETTLAVSGKLAEKSAMLFDIKSEGLDVTASGAVQLPEAGASQIDGRVVLRGRDAREVLALAGLPAPGGLSGTAMAGTVDVSAKGGIVELATQGLTAGESRLTGRATITRPDGNTQDAGNFNVSADIAADRLTVAGLLGWMTGAHRSNVDAGTDSEQFQPVWPDAAFDFNALGRVSGDIVLRSGAMMLTEGLGVRDSTIKAQFAPGKISLTEVEGRAAGGKLTAAADFTQDAGGVSLDGKFKLGADLSALSEAADGTAAAEFTVTGRALSPASLISGLNGSGVVALSGARHPGPAPVVVSDASDSVFSGDIANDAGVITPALTAAIASARVENGTRQIPITIAGGDLKLDSFLIEAPQGSARVSTVVRLASLAVDSVWQVTAVAAVVLPPPEAPADWKPQAKGPLPPVVVVYTGKLDDLKQLTVAVDVSELQRELSVRQMERKVEELDVLRRRDEERAKQELERRKGLEAERVKAAAIAAAAAAAAKAQKANPVEVLPPVIPETSDVPSEAVPQERAPAPVASPDGAGTTQGTTQGTPQGSNQEASHGPAKVPVPIPVPAVESAAGQPEESAQSPPADANVPEIVPQGEAPAVAAPPPVRAVQPKPRPRPAERPRRTTSDELNKALGGWP